MIDDTRDLPSPRPQSCLSASVGEFLKSQVVRAHAVQWANNLSFLTFDDEQTQGSQGLVTEDEGRQFRGQCQPCERRIPIPSGHICDSHSGITKIKEREAELLRYDNPCVHVRDHSCTSCQHIPLFPNSGKVTKFRVRRLNPDEVSFRSCEHFVAVSYFWSSDLRAQNEVPYKVIEDENGKVRNARAPNATLDRAVNFARENGFRMIWIDQECISQDDPIEKELSIQAMDYVYLRAKTSIGLFHTQLEYEHLRNMVLYSEKRLHFGANRRPGQLMPGKKRKLDTNSLIQAVIKIANDRWNTRAWILQEAFVSSGNMLLLFPRPLECDIRGSVLFCHERSQSEIAIQLDALQPILENLSSAVLHNLSATARAPGVRASNSPRKSRASDEELRATCLSLELFHPKKEYEGGTIWANMSKPRRSCNAATALRYLQTRDLERAADKMAIVANMCNYRLRLNSTELDKPQNALSTCIIALSIMNGDFSLLVPELYKGMESGSPEFPSTENEDFSWVHSFTKTTQHIQPTPWNPIGATAMRTPAKNIQLTEDGLSFPGVLWKVDQFIPMETLKLKYEHPWKRLCKAQEGKRPSGRSLNLAATHMLFEIISHLIEIKEARVANAVLNSTSHWKWRNSDHMMKTHMVESVDQFPQGLRIENRKGMFLLDPDYEGTYHQCWLINQVMEKGGIWVGSWAKDGINVAEESDTGTSTCYGSVETSTKISPQGPEDLHTTVAEDSEMEINEASHARNLGVISMLGMMMEEIGPAHDPRLGLPESKDIDVASHLMGASESMAVLASMLTQKGTKKGRKAIFDIDQKLGEQTMVVTPYLPLLESIPRPALRSMSVSWEVVTSTGEVLDLKNGKFTVQRMVKGMWEFSSEISGRYTLK